MNEVQPHPSFVKRVLKNTWGSVIIAIIIVLYGVSIYWSIEPGLFDVNQRAEQQAKKNHELNTIGYTTVTTVIELANTLLTKPGGFLSNDKMPPSVFMDDMPSWEVGVLKQIRNMSLSLLNDFSRSKSQSEQDNALNEALSRFNNSETDWLFPSAESRYQEGIAALINYRTRLADNTQGNAQFYARADNLVSWLYLVNSNLSSMSQRLSASVTKTRVNTDLQGEPDAKQSTQTSADILVKTPWMQIDNVFYESRGSTWALLHLMEAIEHDFHDILVKKNALVSVKGIIRELEATQDTMWSPMVLNGSGFGFVANHSLTMANYVSRVNIDVKNLIDMLRNG